jgi:adenylylsulfate kinase
LEVLIKRDTKVFYKKALYEEGRQDKITNLTGINHHYELPVHPDLIITTDKEPVEKSIKKLVDLLH